MIRFAALLATILLTSCAGMTPKEKEIAEVKKVFESWSEMNIAGNADASYEGMTAGFRSQWLYELFLKEDAGVMAARAALTGNNRIDLDLWWMYHMKHKPGRAELLPNAVLWSSWLKTIYVTYFNDEKAEMSLLFSRMRILDVYLDANGATVSTKLGNKTALFNMTVEGDGWKVDGFRKSLRRASP